MKIYPTEGAKGPQGTPEGPLNTEKSLVRTSGGTFL